MIEQGQTLNLSQEKQLYRIPTHRLQYIHEHGITGADQFVEDNPEVDETLRRYRAQVAFFISEYGYIPVAVADISDSGGGKSMRQLKHAIDMNDDEDIQHALKEVNGVLENHVITTGGSYKAALGENLLTGKDRRPTYDDFNTMYSIMLLGLQTNISMEKMRASSDRARKPKGKKTRIKSFGVEGSFSHQFLSLLSQLPYYELDERGQATQSIIPIGIVPSLEAQVRAGRFRDAIIHAKEELALGGSTDEKLQELIALLKQHKINLGTSRLSSSSLREILYNFPEQGGSFNILSRRQKTDQLIAQRQKELGRGPVNRNWIKWLLENDTTRQDLLEELMRDTFKGEVYKDVGFSEWAVGKVNNNPEEQKVYPLDFRLLEHDLTEIAALYSTLSNI